MSGRGWRVSGAEGACADHGPRTPQERKAPGADHGLFMNVPSLSCVVRAVGVRGSGRHLVLTTARLLPTSKLERMAPRC